MRVDPMTLAAILVMAVITYGTRIAGLFVADRLALSGRAKAAFDAIPPAVLVSVIAPTALTTGWPETIAAAITALAATRLPLLATIAVGVGSVEHNRKMGHGREGHSEAKQREAEWLEIGLGAQILKELGISSIRIMSSRERHYVGLEGFGIKIAGTELI